MWAQGNYNNSTKYIPTQYITSNANDENNVIYVYIGKGNIIGNGYISDTMDGDYRQPKESLYKNFVFQNLTVTIDETFYSQLNELKKLSGKEYNDKTSVNATVYTKFSRALYADEITYEDLEFSKSTGGGIYYSKDINPDNFSGSRPSSFIFISNEIDIYQDCENGTIFLLNSKKEVLTIE